MFKCIFNPIFKKLIPYTGRYLEMYHIKVYHMHKILQVTFNTCKNVSGDKKNPPKNINVSVKLLYKMIFIVICMLNKPSGFPIVHNTTNLPLRAELIRFSIRPWIKFPLFISMSAVAQRSFPVTKQKSKDEIYWITCNWLW